jgi:hypothetical protein
MPLLSAAQRDSAATIIAVDMTGMESRIDLALVIERNTPSGTVQRIDVLSDLADRPTNAPLTAVADAYADGIAAAMATAPDGPLHLTGLCSAALLTLAIAESLESYRVPLESVVLINPRRPSADRAREAFHRARARLRGRNSPPGDPPVPWEDGREQAISAVRRILTEEGRSEMAAAQFPEEQLENLLSELVGRQVAWIWLLLASHEVKVPSVSARVHHIASVQEAGMPVLHAGPAPTLCLHGEIRQGVLGHEQTGAFFRSLAAGAAAC